MRPEPTLQATRPGPAVPVFSRDDPAPGSYREYVLFGLIASTGCGPAYCELCRNG